MIRLLHKIHGDGWTAIIAGGAFRDAFHEKPITHIDFFLKENSSIRKTIAPEYRALDWMTYWFSIFNCEDKNDDVIFLGAGGTLSSINSHLSAVWQVVKGGKRFNVIIIDKDPVMYVNQNFDFGICRAYCDGNKMSFTNEFIEDSMNRTITLYKEHLTGEQIKYALEEHVESIQKKYPGWRLQA